MINLLSSHVLCHLCGPTPQVHQNAFLTLSRNAVWRLAEFHHYGMNWTHWYGRHDFIHPLEYGHASIADMVTYLMHRGLLDLALHPWSKWDDQELQLPLPPPMYPGMVL
jgi:hypothetical protein